MSRHHHHHHHDYYVDETFGCGFLLLGIFFLVAIALVVEFINEFIKTLQAIEPGFWILLAALAVFAAMIVGVVWLGVRYVGIVRRRKQLARLRSTFGADGATLLMQGKLWIGAPLESVSFLYGPPQAVEERQTLERSSQTLMFGLDGRGNAAMKVMLEDGRVVGWDGTFFARR